MKIKKLKYLLCFFVGLLVFIGSSGVCFGSQGDCESQMGGKCPSGCHYLEDPSDCTCVDDIYNEKCSNQILPGLPSGLGGEDIGGGGGDAIGGNGGEDIEGDEGEGMGGGGGGECGEGEDCSSCIEPESGCNTLAGEIWSSERCKCICNPEKKCCGIQLNTVVPFIGDCIEMNTDSSRGDTTSVTSVTAFPILVQGLMKILMSAIMIFSFLMVIVAGLSMTTGAFGGSGFTKGKTIIKNVIISLILLGCSGLILSLINPSFFGG